MSDSFKWVNELKVLGLKMPPTIPSIPENMKSLQFHLKHITKNWEKGWDSSLFVVCPRPLLNYLVVYTCTVSLPIRIKLGNNDLWKKFVEIIEKS